MFVLLCSDPSDHLAMFFTKKFDEMTRVVVEGTYTIIEVKECTDFEQDCRTFDEFKKYFRYPDVMN